MWQGGKKENCRPKGAMDHCRQAKLLKVPFLIDPGLHNTLLAEAHWRQVETGRGTRHLKLKKQKIKFVPYGFNSNLEILGRTKCKLGAEATTIVYVIKGDSESLCDGEALGIINIRPEGQQFRQLVMTTKLETAPAST